MSSFDLHTVFAVLAVASVGAVIGLDRTAFGQFMISQPIVAAPAAGLLLGDGASGLVIGAVLELIWVLDMPVGTFVPADVTICAVSATAIAALEGGGSARTDLIGFTVLLTTAMVPVIMMMDAVIRHYNSHLADPVATAPPEQAGALLSRAQMEGLTVFFLKSFILYLLLVPSGLIAARMFAFLPGKIHTGMALFIKVLPLLGAALILSKLSIKTLNRFFLAGFAASFVLMLTVHLRASIVIPLIIATAFAGGRYRESHR